MQSVSELSGQALDVWVARAEDRPTRHWRRVIFIPSYSTDWRAGGPIIERAQIQLRSEQLATGVRWQAGLPDGKAIQYGRTPLEAAMRCYIAHQFGESIDEKAGQ